MSALGVVVFPLAAVLLLAYHGYGHEPSRCWLAPGQPCLAGAAGLRHAEHRRAAGDHAVAAGTRPAPPRVPPGCALPPLADLESLLFRVITVGFALLTLTLVTGVLFVDDLLAQKLVHKTVLSVLSWIVFGVLMIGRRRYGWRGMKAVHWTLAAMLLLLLAFFGSQFVIELVFGHSR